MIWNYSIPEITKGYTEQTEGYRCVICEVVFEKGKIYNFNDTLVDAYGAVKLHVREEHGATVDFLLAQEISLTGISEVQRNILQLMSGGVGDKEISKEVGIACSTVRNHRFKLREKEKQAKLYLALMESLEQKINCRIEVCDKGVIEDMHMSAAMVDERYSITEQDKEKTISVYMDENGGLKQFPTREKKKIIVLSEIIKNFKKDTPYSEGDVNKVLKRIYAADYVGIRRALIEYGFMDRTSDCKVYQVRE